MRLFAIYRPVLREIPRKTGLFLCFHGFFRLFSFPGLFWTLHVFQQEQRQHHEIYLSDARKIPPDRLRTLLRQPIRMRQKEELYEEVVCGGIRI